MIYSNVRKWFAFSGVMMLCAGLLPWRAAVAATGTRELPAPTGKLSVGRVTFFWTDDSRPELGTEDKDDHRELRIDVWYPAEPHQGAAHAPYFPDLRMLGKQMGLESIRLGSITGHTFAAPPIVPGAVRYPVLVLSPGAGSIGILYTGLVEELVSYGYIVATVDHPFQSRAIAYPDGRIVTSVAAGSSTSADPQARELEYQSQIEVRALDLRFVLDQLTRMDKETETQFAGRLDLARVAVVGHSIGGIAAAKAALADTRIKAIVNLDGHEHGLPFILDDKGHGPRQPLLELTDGNESPTDKQLATWKMSRAYFEQGMAAMTKRANELMNSIDGGSFRVTAPGIRHASFSDMAIWDSDSVEARHRRIQIVRDYSRAFLDKVLRNNQHTLLNSDASPYAEVTVERFAPAQ